MPGNSQSYPQTQNTQTTTAPTAEQSSVVEQPKDANLDLDNVDLIDDPSVIPGVPPEKVEQWKNDFGVIFRFWFLDQQYIYRNFTYPEYIEVRKKLREEYKNDVEGGDDAFKLEVQKMCVLWPEDYFDRIQPGHPKPIPGGIPGIMGDYIIVASGFSDTIIPDIIGGDDQQS